jgi:hypothetical protein
MERGFARVAVARGKVDSRLLVEALASAAVAAVIASVLAWLGPPGADLAAHAYQRTLFLDHGFSLWNNFWYAGRYSFVTYSLLYYPLAAALGIRPLAVATIAIAALAFAVVIGREWGPLARWSSRTFAVVWAGIVLSAAFPFALGIALALLAIWALQSGARARFAVCAALTMAASPVAFLLLVIVLAGVGLERRTRGARLGAPVLTIAVIAVGELLLWRAFPASGRYPFTLAEFLAVSLFCVLGALATWNVQSAATLRVVFLVYLGASLIAFAVPSSVGENVARLRFLAVPVAVLTLSLRSWRPRVVCAGLLALAVSWNIGPLVASFVKGRRDAGRNAAYWQSAIGYLRAHLEPSYRVEAVDTVGHWAAAYLAQAGIPLARGWFRQDDFPQNRVLYGPLGRHAYLSWLRSLGVRYVVVTSAPPDYSARAERRLLASGQSGLRPVLRTPTVTIYSVPGARGLVSGPGRPRVVSFGRTRVVLRLDRPGRFRIAVRHSPYWKPSAGCLVEGADGMLRLVVRHAGTVRLSFDVDLGRALATAGGRARTACAS